MQSPIRDEKSGAWSYPESWSTADREAWEATCGELLHHEREAERIEAAGVAMLNSPAMQLAAKRVEVDAAKERKARAERRAKGEVAWVQARAAHGDRVARIDGEEGDVIIMVTPNEDAIIYANQRADDVIRAILRAVPADADEKKRLEADKRALTESTAAILDELIKHTAIGGLEADESAKRMRELVSRYGGLRPLLHSTRDDLVRGWRVNEGKGSAL